MAGLEHLDAIERAFISLLDDLAASWPADDIAEVREDVHYGEYGEALENMVAIAEHRGRPFCDRHADAVIALATSMKMRDSPWVAKVRQLT